MRSIKVFLFGYLLAALAGCASHRPPDCKGPYSPIQPATSGVAHGA